MADRKEGQPDVAPPAAVDKDRKPPVNYEGLGIRAIYICIVIGLLMWMYNSVTRDNPGPLFVSWVIFLHIFLDVAGWAETNFYGGRRIAVLGVYPDGKVWLEPQGAAGGVHAGGLAIEVTTIIDKHGKVFDFSYIDTLRPTFPAHQQ